MKYCVQNLKHENQGDQKIKWTRYKYQIHACPNLFKSVQQLFVHICELVHTYMIFNNIIKNYRRDKFEGDILFILKRSKKAIYPIITRQNGNSIW